MTDITTGVVGRLAARLAAACDPREILLFGSYAKGLADRNSDIDLLVVTEAPAGPALRHAAFDATRGAIHVDLHLHTVDEMASAAADSHGFLGSILGSGCTVYLRAGSRSVRGLRDP